MFFSSLFSVCDKQNVAEVCDLGVLFPQELDMCKKQKWLKIRVKMSSGKHFVTVKTVREIKNPSY